MTRRTHLKELEQAHISEQIAIGEHLHDDICRECAADVGTPWPEGAQAPYFAPCNWCGRSDVPLMPVAELEAVEAA